MSEVKMICQQQQVSACQKHSSTDHYNMGGNENCKDIMSNRASYG